MTNMADDSTLKKWKAGWGELWRFLIIYVGFYFVAVFLGMVLHTPVFETSEGKVVRWIIFSLLVLVGLPFLSYYAARWYDASRWLWTRKPTSSPSRPLDMSCDHH